MMWNARWLWIQWRGNVLHLELIWGTPIFLDSWGDIIVLLLLWQCSWDSLQFHQGNRGSLRLWLGTRNSSAQKAGESGLICGEGDVSWVFSSCTRHLVYILELRRGWPFETRVCSAKSGLLSIYDVHLGKLNYAWQENTDASAGEPGGQAALISWHIHIGIPINFHKESGIVTIWSIEFSAPLEFSNGCEVLCPEEVEIYGFL